MGRHDPENNADRAQGFSIVDMSVHPQFDGEVCCGRTDNNWFYGVKYDFMLLKLSGESNTPPIRLNKSSTRPRIGEDLYVIGFGDIDRGYNYEEPDKLQEVTVTYMSNEQCVANSIYPSELLNAASMCAADYREDACSGDSGGPLIAKGSSDADDVLMGVVSWGWDCAVEPGVYARVSYGYSWIRSEVCRLSSNPPSSFLCPTQAPDPTPRPSPRPTTPLPTRRPTPTPTLRPTAMPTLHPTNLPTIQPSAKPTSAPSTGPTSWTTARPSLEPTIGPTLYGNIFDSSGKAAGAPSQEYEITPGGDLLAKADIDLLETLARKPIHRRLLPAGKSCVAASISPSVCCSSISNKQDSLGEECLPAIGKSAFEGGMPCEASSWIQANDPESYTPSICDNIHQQEEAKGEEGSASSSIPPTLSLFSNRRYLPMGISCNNITRATDCCQFLDNRSEQDSMYHGQPCVPVRITLGLPTSEDGDDENVGLCQPANYVAAVAPGRAMDCSDLLPATTSTENATDKAIWKEYLEELLEELQEDIYLDQREISLSRTDLPVGQQCQAIRDPLVCCAARSVVCDSTDGHKNYHNCIAIKQPSLLMTSAGSAPATARSREGSFSCLPSSSGTLFHTEDIFNATTKTTLLSEAQGVANKDTPSSTTSTTTDDDFCESLVQTRTSRSIQLKTDDSSLVGQGHCSSLKSSRSCCSAIDANGQPCMPVRTAAAGSSDQRSCASMDWIVANLLSNADVALMDCSSI